MTEDKSVEDLMKPCPFCGGEAKIEQFAKNGFHLKCKSCLIGYKQRVLRNSLEWLKAYMIKEWNTRIQPTPIDSKEGAEEQIQDFYKDCIYDFSGIPEAEKDKLVRVLVEITAKHALQLFMSLGLKTHIESMVVNDATGEEFIFSFKKIPKQ